MYNSEYTTIYFSRGYIEFDDEVVRGNKTYLGINNRDYAGLYLDLEELVMLRDGLSGLIEKANQSLGLHSTRREIDIKALDAKFGNLLSNLDPDEVRRWLEKDRNHENNSTKEV